MLIKNQRTPGLAGARNSGILAATGELVAFCDDDDEWLPEKLARQVARLQATPSAAASTTGILVRYKDRTTTRLAPTVLVTHRQLLRSRLTELHPSTVLARRRQLLDDIGLVDEEIPGSYAEDYEWLLRASRLGPVLAVAEPLAVIHWHQSSFFADRWRTIISALTYLVDKHQDLQGAVGTGPHLRPDRLRPRGPGGAAPGPALGPPDPVAEPARAPRLPGHRHQPGPDQRQERGPDGACGRQGHLAPVPD